ncbi:MAG: DNA internalization-related competence protein ComEC/Rec2, partial [Sutterellaceae bacterium]|nr:DNA internalization-related competence protein ComEC/Rec2 [Burkholderiaceae bacterium]MDW8429401.1 DNA internalization-related competence protein ComEC/Rec2 [Sutterellaceae bacterium]
EAWLLERGVRATGYVRAGRAAAGAVPMRIDPMVWRPGYAVERARDVLRERLQRRLEGQRHAGVLIALVLGEQRAIPEHDWLLFQRTGIAHLVSISGLHITMIGALAALAAGALWRRRPALLARAPAQSAAAVAAVGAAFVYCLLAGWGVPAQRTFFMLATVAAALALRRATRPALTLALAATVVTVLDPWAVLAPGFWLSFGAVAAIFYAFYGRPPLAAGWRGRLQAAVRAQLWVTVALVPLTVALFQQVSLVSPLANAVAIPVVSLLVTPLSLIGAACVAWPPPFAELAGPVFAVAHGLLVALIELLQTVAHWPWASVALAAPPAWAVPLAVAGTAWLMAPRGWPLRSAGAVWLLPLALWPAARPGVGELWVTALDVGQGAAILVETREATMLYDAGPRYTPQADAGGRVILPYLRWRGIGRIDLLVLSHLDSDHAGGAASVIKGIDVATVLTSIDAGHPTLAAARRVQRCEAGRRLALGELTLAVLHPTAADDAAKMSSNARSCVVALQLGAWRVLLAGDLPQAQEAALVARQPDLRADLLALPHHGSRHSSSEAFVQATAPRWAFVQAGYRNRFGHPDATVVARYRSAGAEVLRTDHLGALQWRLRADGSVTIFAQRRHAARYWHNQPEAQRATLQAAETDNGDTMPNEETAPMPAGG